MREWFIVSKYSALKINLYHFHPSNGEAKLHGRLNSEYLNSNKTDQAVLFEK